MSISSFNKVQDVVNYQNAVASFAGNQSKDNSDLIEEIKNKEIERLENLLDALLAQEQKLKQYLSQGSLELTEKRLDIWNNSGIQNILNRSGEKEYNNAIKTIMQKITSEWFHKNLAEAIKQDAQNGQLQKYFQMEATQSKAKDVAEQVVASFKRGIQDLANLRNMPKKSFELQIIKEQIEEAQTFDNIKEAPKINIIFSGDISPTYVKRIEAAIKQISGYSFRSFPVSQELQKQIKFVFQEMLQQSGVSTSSEPALIFFNVLQQRFNNFDINQSASSIKGFMGEAYWTAFWEFIGMGKLNVTPAGSSLITSSGVTGAKKIPIDLFLEDIGFQIKNYSMINIEGEDHIFFPPHHAASINIDSFFESRLDMPSEADAIRRFFYSWGYNRVVQGDQHAQEVFGQVEDRFNTIFNALKMNLEMLASGRIDKIIKMDNTFSFDLDLIDTSAIEQERYNTVYLIGNHFVFSSDIVLAIIRGIRNGSGIYIKINQFDTSALHQPDLGIVYPEGSGDWKASAAMTKQTIKYQIEINVTQLANDLINILKSIN